MGLRTITGLSKEGRWWQSRAMKEKAEKEIENLGKNPNSIFKFVKSMQKDVEGVHNA